MIWIIGGTTETSYILPKIKDRFNYVISTATQSAKEFIEDEHIIVSRMNYEEMLEFIKNRGITSVVDVSHPYAVEVSKNAKLASRTCGIQYLRFVRKAIEVKEAVYVKDIEACRQYLSKVKGCVVFTTGIKNIGDFEKVKNNNRFVYRVLPTNYSIEACMENNIKIQDIIAILGPFSKELNLVLFKEFKADFVVMKNSGIEGGTPEKLGACLEYGCIPIIIGRAYEEGIYDMDELVEMIK